MLSTRNVEKNEFVVSCDRLRCKKEQVFVDNHSDKLDDPDCEYLPPGWMEVTISTGAKKYFRFYACSVSHAVLQMAEQWS